MEMQNEANVAVLPEGYAGGLLVEIEEERREEESIAEFIAYRARSLAWQAVRNTPFSCTCADTCLNWLRQAHLWASRRCLESLEEELAEIIRRLEESLPVLRVGKYKH